MLRGSGVSDKGRIRPTNEDCFAIDEPRRLCVVADGMGGHNAGEIASRIAVDAVVDHVRGHRSDWPFGFDPDLTTTGNRLRTAVYLAHLQVLEAAATTSAYAGMGTTLVASVVENGRMSVAHVGDSRLYVFAGGRLRQVTRDDSWLATVLAADPSLDRVMLQHHPMCNALTNVVGAGTRTEVHVTEEAVTGGDWLCLSTDGVHGVLADRRIAMILGEADDPADAADRLVAAALARGSRDNCTAVVARYDA